MRKAVGVIASALIGVLGIPLLAADPPPADYQNAMKALGAAMQAVAKAAAANDNMDFETLVKSAKAMHDPFKVVITFWDLKKSSAPLGWAKAGDKNAYDLETAAALEEAEGVEYAMKELQAQCAACHERHREKGPDGGFLIRY